jgi:eukaryotic-like serine/threonine-protein kinase
MHDDDGSARPPAHRNVVSIMDFGEDSGVPYLVMEHVVGRRLGDLVAERGGVPVAQAVRIVGQILAGLQAVHDAGIVHSDVRCANILVESAPGASAVPRLIDFGLARVVDDPSAGCAGPEWLTAGTPEYLAPDLIRGDAPTFASDVYAAGVLLYKGHSRAGGGGGGDDEVGTLGAGRPNAAAVSSRKRTLAEGSEIPVSTTM